MRERSFHFGLMYLVVRFPPCSLALNRLHAFHPLRHGWTAGGRFDTHDVVAVQRIHSFVNFAFPAKFH